MFARMDWSRSIDAYCERTDPSFWAEPVNALTNAAFLIAAFLAWRMAREAGERSWAVGALIAVLVAIGIGSFLFHTFATAWAAIADVAPIAIFVFGFFALAMRRFLNLAGWALGAAILVFLTLHAGLIALLPRGALNGSGPYLPALAALALVGAGLRFRGNGAGAEAARRRAAGMGLMAAAGVLALSVAFRSLDMALCEAIPLGLHFLWHALNAVVLFLALRVAIRHGPASTRL